MVVASALNPAVKEWLHATVEGIVYIGWPMCTHVQNAELVAADSHSFFSLSLYLALRRCVTALCGKTHRRVSVLARLLPSQFAASVCCDRICVVVRVYRCPSFFLPLLRTGSRANIIVVFERCFVYSMNICSVTLGLLASCAPSNCGVNVADDACQIDRVGRRYSVCRFHDQVGPGIELMLFHCVGTTDEMLLPPPNELLLR